MRLPSPAHVVTATSPATIPKTTCFHVVFIYRAPLLFTFQGCIITCEYTAKSIVVTEIIVVRPAVKVTSPLKTVAPPAEISTFFVPGSAQASST